MNRRILRIIIALPVLLLVAGCIPAPTNAEYRGAKTALTRVGFNPRNCAAGMKTKPPYLRCDTRYGRYDAIDITRNSRTSTVKMRLDRTPRKPAHKHFTYTVDKRGNVSNMKGSVK